MDQQDRDIEINLDKAGAFFKRAEQVADTDNFDYAIDMYLEGLHLAPDAVEDGHIPLRKLSLVRQGKGGKKPTLFDKVRKNRGKGTLDEMLNSEYLLAKNPDNISYAEAMLKAAVAGGYNRAAEWVAGLIFDANRSSAKPSFATYLLLKDSYLNLQLLPQAVVACQQAVELKPDNLALKDELRNIMAQMTVEKGKYGQEGDFRRSIKDRDSQDQLHAQENIIKSIEVRRKTLDTARKAFDKNPTPSNTFLLVDALTDLEEPDAFNQAVEILRQQYDRTNDFDFKRKEGQIKIKHFRNQIRAAEAQLNSDPDNHTLKETLGRLKHQLNQFEIEHYQLSIQHYPTDLKLKYQLGISLLGAKRYDEAIPLFQEAQRDPARKLAAMEKTGLCFFLKGWYTDAVDIFEEALAACEVRDSPVGKEIRYHLARSYEAMGQKDKALEIFRKLAQLDFAFKDVKERIDKIRGDSA